MLSIPDESVVREDSTRIAMYLVCLGITVGLSSFLHTFMFNVSGIRLTTRLREMVFSHTLKQEMGWFDDARNGVGVLCARLSGDCASVQGVRISIFLYKYYELVYGRHVERFLDY